MKRLVCMAAGLVSAGVVFAPLSPGAATTACGQSGWAATAQGAPRVAASGYYTWHDAAGWHLRFKGAGPSIAGRISTNAPIGLVRATPRLRSALKAGSRGFSFRLAATRGMEGVDFRASCASRLNVAFGAAVSASAAKLPVFLGATGPAPAPTFQLTRPALADTGGVAGSIVVTGTCPGAVGPGHTCPPPQPMQGTVRIETVAATRGGPGGGELVKTVDSDANGNFSTDLAPGTYSLVVEKETPGYPVPVPSIVTVQAGVVTDVVLTLDGGAR